MISPLVRRSLIYVVFIVSLLFLVVIAYRYVNKQRPKSEEKQRQTLVRSEVHHQADSLYAHFRQRFPYHHQGIYRADMGDKSRLLVIAEPPPQVVLDSIKYRLRKWSASLDIRHHPMGYDGFVSDILIEIAKVDDSDFEDILKDVSSYLFHTDYKPIIGDLRDSVSQCFFSDQNLDYQISLYEFNQWFLLDKERFFSPNLKGFSWDLATLMRHKVDGVFFSAAPGFVAWILPKGADLKYHRAHIRQFCLDGDLILGAVSDTSMLAIIARERETPLNVLAPLYTETVCLLASIGDRELSQSLDVNDVLAGKMPNGRDWCPTYLSPELENTEFGNLMTLTDILLKDWSEKGTIDERDYNYPEPSHYPFKQALFSMLGLNELVYNWNTADAMYAIDQNGFTLYTLNRTGALPVSYFNGAHSGYSIGYGYEQQAYDYFGSTGNGDLARVVQYTALYQLFMDNGIRFSDSTYGVFPKNKPFLLNEPMQRLLTNIKTLDDPNIERIADSIGRAHFRLYLGRSIDKQIRNHEQRMQMDFSAEQRQQIVSDYRSDVKQSFVNDLRWLRSRFRAMSANDFNSMSRYLSYPRGFRSQGHAFGSWFTIAREVADKLTRMGKPNYSLLGVNLSTVRSFYSDRLLSSAAPYLKTPSMVVTFNDFITTGGHNISSKISRVKTLQNYKRRPSRPTAPSVQGPRASSPNVAAPQSRAKAAPASTPKAESSPKPHIRDRQAVIPVKARAQRGL